MLCWCARLLRHEAQRAHGAVFANCVCRPHVCVLKLALEVLRVPVTCLHTQVDHERVIAFSPVQAG